MRVPVPHPLHRPCGPRIRRIAPVLAGERIAGEIVEDIRRRAEASQLDPDQVMVDVLIGLAAELGDAQRGSHHPGDLADLVRGAAEAANGVA